MRLVLVSDGQGDLARLKRILAACIAGGLRAMQLREAELSPEQYADFCSVLRPMLEEVKGLLISNARTDPVAKGLADGVHLGRASLSPSAARSILPEAIIGFSAHSAAEIAWASGEAADYVSLSPVLPSSCKPGEPALGMVEATGLTRAAALPVIWLGGFTADNIDSLPAGAAGLALRSGLCDFPDPESAVRRILRAIS
jgi:thiamine-phosphate pyrophosphorylase